MADHRGEDDDRGRDRPRKKRSNFDMTPDEYVKTTGQAPQQIGNGAGGLTTAQSVIKRYGASGLRVDATQIRSLIDQSERDRIARARAKNIDYLQRKIQEERAAKYGFGQENPQHDEDDLVYPVYGPASAKKKGGYKRTNAGIGNAAAAGLGTKDMSGKGLEPDTSVYVNGLPPEITWDQLDLLFSPYGHVKRIKIYRDAHGRPKGDALVSYGKPTSVQIAINKLNGQPLDNNHTIRVSKADFGVKDENATDGVGFDQQAHMAQEEEEQAGYEQLPPECEADQYPVLILRNVYKPEDAEGDATFFPELEMDMLQECVKYGDVRRIVTPEGAYYEGSIAVVFANLASAQACAQAMHGRFFDGQQIEVEMQGKVDTEQVAGRILPVSHPATGLVSRDYGEEGEEEGEADGQVAGKMEIKEEVRGVSAGPMGIKEEEGGRGTLKAEALDDFFATLAG